MNTNKYTDDELIEYDRRSDLMKKLIVKKYPNHKFNFFKHPLGGIVHVEINDISIISIMVENNWTEIKRHIEKKIKTQDTGIYGDCDICYEEIKKNTTCPKCANNCCLECYIKIFTDGEGIIKCPHCRFSYGQKMNKFMLDIGVSEIRRKIG